MSNDMNNNTPGDVSQALQGLRTEVEGNITTQKKRRKIMIGVFLDPRPR